MLNKEIRDVLLNYLKLDKSITSYLNMFSEDIVIRPNSKNIEYEETNDIYEIITKKLDSLKQKGVALENITDVLKTDIDNYLCSVSKHFNNTNSNLNNLYKLVSKDIVLATMQFIEYAREKLQVNFSNHFLFSLSLHIQELIKRVEENNVSSNQHLFKIKKEHPEEFSVANDLVKKISNKFGIIVPESEKGFLALLLFHSRVEISDNNKIGIIIICHGDSTATSIANTCNMLLNTNMMKAIDMPLSQSIDETYKKLKSMALAINKGKGIIILADMGSLLDFDKKLTSETGIKTKVVKNVSTPIALEMLRHVLYDMEDIDNVYEQAKFVEDNCNKIVVAKKKELAILSVCATGKGSSIIAKNILEELIDKYYADKIKIIPVDLENAKDVFKKMQDRYYILAVVGTIDPILPIPFFPINQLMQSEIQQVFFHLLDGNINGIFMLPENKANYTIFETAKDLLEKYVKFINPKYAITKIRKFIEKIEYLMADCESAEVEFKSARGGFPGSLWETYSAFANTQGGVIVLGVKEKDGKFTLDGITLVQARKYEKEFWDNVNNKAHCSATVLQEKDVQDGEYNGSYVLVFNVPRAPRNKILYRVGRVCRVSFVLPV
mgnify:CR=1 FL=1